VIASGLGPDFVWDDYRVLTLTAPGWAELPDAVTIGSWNREHARRCHTFWTNLKKLAPGAEYVRVLELQRRGAYHTHWLVRGASGLSSRRVAALAAGHGFGPRMLGTWQHVRTMDGVARYLVKYMSKARDAFPPRTHVFSRSYGWTLRDPDALASSPDVSGDDAAVRFMVVGPRHGESWLDVADRLEAGRRARQEAETVGDRLGAILGGSRPADVA
jgi:hypothetical protein